MKNRSNYFQIYLALTLFLLSSCCLFSQNEGVLIDSTFLINETNKLLNACAKPRPLPLMSIYFKGGMSLSKKKSNGTTYFNTQMTDYTSKIGFGVLSGIGIEYYFSKNIALSTEIFYSYKTLNSQSSFNNNLLNTVFIERQNWIEFPIY